MNEFKHILLATDLTDENIPAVEKAKMFHKTFTSKLSVISAVSIPAIYSYKMLGPEEIHSELLQEYQPYFDKFIETHNLPKENSHLKVGRVSDLIYNFIGQNDVDCLVLGSENDIGMSDAISSTVLKLLQRTNCNVFIACST